MMVGDQIKLHINYYLFIILHTALYCCKLKILIIKVFLK